MKEINKYSSKGILFLLLVISSFILQSNLVTGQTVLNNLKLRFGTGAENSVNTTGNLQQPFYYNSTLALWRKLTYSTYPLDNTFAIGGDGTTEWNLNGTLLANPAITGQVIDLSGYVVTTPPNGYGTIISNGTVNIGGSNLGIQHKYELGMNSSYIKVTTKITNTSGSPVNNVRFWIGTRDDYVGGTDQPLKEKGNLVNGAFVMQTDPAVRGLALRISTSTEGALFYTNSTKGNNIINSCCDWINVTNQNPQTSIITITHDGSYGFYVRMNDLAVGASDEFTWYYAAGPLADLEDIIAEVAAASGAVQDITCTSATFEARSDVAGTGYWMVVPRNSTAPTAAQIKAGVDYGSVVVVQSGSGAMIANVDELFYLTGLSAGTDYDLYFVVEDAVPAFSAIASLQFSTLDYGIPTITCPADISVNNDPGLCGAIVTYVAPVGADNCGVGVTLQTAGLPSGSVFPIGITTNTFEVTGGGGLTNTCSFTVTVTENVLPVITCPLSQTQTADLGVCEAGITIPLFNGGCDIQYGFTGHYQPANWTLVNTNGGNGTVNTGGAPGSISIQGSNNLSGNPSETRYENLIPCNGTLSFDWTYSTADVGPGYDPMGYYLNGIYTQLTTNGGGLNQSGSVSIPVLNGDVFSFCIRTTDNGVGASTTINSNFSAPVPGGTAADNCGIASILNNFNNTNDASGNYPVGTTNVLWTVTDLSGNTASCMQTITVTDNEAPAINCPGNISQSNDLGTCDAVVNYTTPVGTDNCSGATTVQTAGLPSGATFPLGITTNTFVVTDGVGLTATCSFDVTVTDSEPPAASCNSLTVYLDGTGNATITPADVNNGSTDNCGIAGYSLSESSFDCSDVQAPATTIYEIVEANLTNLPGWPIGCPPTSKAYAQSLTGPSYGFNWADATPPGAVITDIQLEISWFLNCNSDPSAELNGQPYGILTKTGTECSGCASPVVINAYSLNSLISSYNQGGANNFNIIHNWVNFEGIEVNPAWGAGNNVYARVHVTYSIPPMPVILTVTDVNGNSSTCNSIVTVLDTISPVIACPSDISVNSEPGLCSAVVTYAAPVGTDNCSGANTVQTAGLPSGATFPVGTTTNTFVVTDAAGLTATCSFDVTVTDIEGPSISCPGDITVNNDLSIPGNLIISPIAVTTSFVTEFSTDINNTINGAGLLSFPSLTANHGGSSPIDSWVALNGLGSVVYDLGSVQDVAGFSFWNQNGGGPGTLGTSGIQNVQLLYSTDNVNFFPIPGAPSAFAQVPTNDSPPEIFSFPTIAASYIRMDVLSNWGDTYVGYSEIAFAGTPSISFCSAVVNYATPVGTDNCSGAATVQTAGLPSGAAFPVGTTTNTFVVTDLAGLTATCSFDVTVIDVDVPTIICPADVNVSTDLTSCEASGVVLGTPITTDNCGVATVTNDAPLTFPLGFNTVTWTVTDIHGLTATCPQIVSVYDGVPPTIVCAPDVTVNNDPGACLATNVNIGFPVATDNCTVVSVTNDYGTNNITLNMFDSYGDGWNGGNLSVYINGIYSGAYSVTAGSAYSETATFTLGMGSTIDFVYSGGSFESENTYNIIIDGNTVFSDGPNPTVGPVYSYTNPVQALTTFPVGTTTLTWTVFDGELYATCTQQITVIDNEAPSIFQCAYPTGIVSTVDPGRCEATINLPDAPIVFDNCGIASIVNNYTGTSNLSSIYPVGPTVVTWTITDIHGNSSTCQTHILVSDNVPPTAVTQNITVYLNAQGVAAITPDQIDNGSADNCSIINLTLSESVFSCNDLGPNTVTLTVTDIDNNQSSATAIVTVLDTVSPVILCPANITVSTNSGCTATGVVLGTPIATDNCSVVNVSNDAPVAFPLGNTIVTWTAVDGSGNIGTCTQIVTVIDGENPSITCPANIVTVTNSGCTATGVILGTPITADNCNVANVANNAPAAFPLGTTTIVWTVTDDAGNYTTCEQLVTVNDTTKPTITCPADVTVATNTGCTATGVDLGTPVTADNCGIASVTNDGPLVYPLGNTTVTWTVTDNSGNIVTCTQLVTVIDDVAPIVHCPPAIVRETNTGCSLTGLVLDVPLVIENCNITSLTNDAPLAFPLGNTTVTWTAVDGSGNIGTCTQLVTVIDGENPSITCPANIVTVTNTGCTATGVVLGTPVTADNCNVATVTNNAPAAFPLGTTTVVWTVTDDAGNYTTCEQLVTVNDTLKPSIVCPPTVIVSANTGCTATGVALGTPVTSDNCSIASVSNDGLLIYPLGNTTVTWTVTDGSGNIATCTQLVTVIDDVAPIVHCAPAIVRETNTGCTLTGLVLDVPLVTENCNITSLTNDAPIAFPLGNTTVTWTAVDGSGNIGTCTQLVTVIDGENPSITCPANIVTVTNTGCTATGVILGTPITADNCNVANVANNAPAAFPLGTTTVVWTVTDDAGNYTTCEQLVTVNDTTKPTITCPADVTVATNTGCTATGVDLGTPVTGDNCSVASVTNDGLLVYPLGTTIVTWTVTDASGNSDTCTQLVTVIDNVNPIVHCPPAIIKETNTGCTLTGFVLDVPFVTENCTLVSLTNDAPPAFPLGNTTVTWTAIDGSGNIGICTQLITVIDNVDPTIVCPANVVTVTNTGCTATGVALGTPVTADNCNVATVVNNAPAVFPLGTTTVIWTVTDGSGNTATCNQLVTVNDNVLPTITCPATVTVFTNTGCTATGVDLGAPVTGDNCGVASVTNNAPGVYPLGNTTVTWTVTDNAGNLNTCTQIVTVIDNVVPVIHCAPAIVVPTNTACTATGLVLDIPLVTENCTVASLINNAPSVYPLGNTTVTWTVTDGSGNSATCTQLVTVIDNVPPVITCPANVVAPTNTGCTATGVALGTPVTSDNCGVASVTNNAPAVYPLGITTVTWIVTDNAGLTATCDQLVTVIDTTPPVILCPVGLTVNTVPGGCDVTGVSIGFPTYTDNCSVGMGVTNDALVTYPIGITNITWSVTDASGNTSTCVQTVTVGCTPLAVNDTVTTPENTPIIIDVLANDTDCGNNINPASVTIVSVPVNGTVVVNSDGTITYTPDYLFVGTNQFDYQVCDSLGLCDIGTVYIIVTPVNNPVLGIAKALSRIEELDNGTFNLTYIITAENLGNDVITKIQITDNLDETFPLPTLYTVLSVPYTNGTLTPNSLFNGSTDINLLDSSASSLNIGATATVEFTVNVAIYGNEAQVFYNYAIGSGYGSFNTISSDTSNNGYIADPDNNLNPGDNSNLTPVTLTPEDVFIPNGFSPDGDNINDFFVITGIEDFPDSKLSIYNRWGNLIYTTTAYQNDWDGKPNSGIVIGDMPVPPGTYFYVLEYNKDNREPVIGYVIVQY